MTTRRRGSPPAAGPGSTCGNPCRSRRTAESCPTRASGAEREGQSTVLAGGLCCCSCSGLDVRRRRAGCKYGTACIRCTATGTASRPRPAWGRTPSSSDGLVVRHESNRGRFRVTAVAAAAAAAALADLPLAPQSAHEMSSSGSPDRFDTRSWAQRLQMVVGKRTRGLSAMVPAAVPAGGRVCREGSRVWEAPAVGL